MSEQTYIKLVPDLDNENTRSQLRTHLEEEALTIDEVLMLAELHSRGMAVEIGQLSRKIRIGAPSLMREMVGNLSALGWVEIVKDGQ
jgi:Mn-dependent DtxR family transcriptional regulator